MKQKMKENPNNIWNKEDFRMCRMGEKNRFLAYMKYFRKCLKWSLQRITRGYADCDLWSMDTYLQRLLPDMLQTLKDTRSGSPSYLGRNYTNEDGILVNDTCHAEWDKILDRMIFLWRESCENTCSRKNPHEEEYFVAFEAFRKKYGLFGEKLQTDEEMEENRKRGGGGTVHFMDEVSEYQEISGLYGEESKKLAEYREKCKNEALDMLKEYFDDLWD